MPDTLVTPYEVAPKTDGWYWRRRGETAWHGPYPWPELEAALDRLENVEPECSLNQ